MNKLVVFMCVAVFACVGMAGIEPGTIELSGASTFMYSSQTIEVDDAGDLDLSFMTLALDGVYYMGPLGVGGTFSYMSATVEIGGDDVELSGYLIGPTVKYVHPINDQLSVFGVGSVGMASATVELMGDDQDADGYFFRLGGGAKYFLSESVSVDGSLNYQFASMDVDDVTAEASGFTLGVGLSVYLPTGM